MAHEDKLKSVLHDEIERLNELIAPLEKRRDAAWTLIHSIAAEQEAETENPGTPTEAPRKKRHRRTNAEIAADNAALAAAAAKADGESLESGAGEEEAAQ